MASSSKQRAQGAGRKSNSEPKMQVFKEFNGCNFELSPRSFSLNKTVDQEQSDLQMNYLVVQNNAAITSNNTIETLNSLVQLFTAPTGLKFTNVCILIGKEFYIAMNDHSIQCYSLDNPSAPPLAITLIDNSGVLSLGHTWTSFAYVDDQLIAMTEENYIWTGALSTHTLSNAKRIPEPAGLTVNFNLTAHGDLVIASSYDADNHPYRIQIAHAYVNKYGPTTYSTPCTFYANYPLAEWSIDRYVSVFSLPAADLNVPLADIPDYGLKAVELYYSTGDSSELLIAGYMDIDGADWWTFDWYGYIDSTSMWPAADLIAPTENYTSGVAASRVTCIDSRVYFWGNSSNPQRLYIGGNPGNLLSVSPGVGGGFVDVEPGTNQSIKVVTKYKTQSGASIVTILCDSPNSQKEQRYNLVENSVSLSNEQSMKSWQAEQVAGAVGCKSYYGALVCEDGLYSISRYGLALTTLTMEYNTQIQTNYVSDAIKPAFTDLNRKNFNNSVLIEADGVIYVGLGTGNAFGTLSDIIFCYDIDKKAWWTITSPLLGYNIAGASSGILQMFHVDYDGAREGIGFVLEKSVYMLPLTKDDSPSDTPTMNVTLQSGELATQQPMQNWQYLSQLEFRFDYFRGDIVVELTGIDQFGRKVTTKKEIKHNSTQYDLVEWMRVDLRLISYQIRITGIARFRLTHFIARVYQMSSKVGMVWGFDSSQNFRSNGDIHPSFNDYNDIKKAIIP